MLDFHSTADGSSRENNWETHLRLGNSKTGIYFFVFEISSTVSFLVSTIPVQCSAGLIP